MLSLRIWKRRLMKLLKLSVDSNKPNNNPCLERYERGGYDIFELQVEEICRDWCWCCGAYHFVISVMGLYIISVFTLFSLEMMIDALLAVFITFV